MERGALWEYQVFCAVAERQSFVLAARALGASPSAVTRAVQALERQVGVQLLLRSKSSVVLTPQGESYFQSARDLLRREAQAREALRDTQLGAQGRLRFSAPDLLGVTLLPAVLRRYAADYPGVTVDITYTDKSVDPTPKDWTSPSAAAFRHPATCSVRGSGPMHGCCAPAPITSPAWACRANRKNWPATGSSCIPARAC